MSKTTPKATIVRATLVSAFVALAACTQPSAATSEPAAPAPAATPASAPVPAPALALTTKGLGPMRIGMTDAEARAAVGAANIEADTGTEMSDSCTEIKLKGDYPGIYLMINDGRLSRISIWEGTAKTDKGIGLGATPEQVAAAYPGILSSAHEYEDPPARYMTAWVTPEKEGVRFEVNHTGVVGAIYAGDSTINYSEGCA